VANPAAIHGSAIAIRHALGADTHRFVRRRAGESRRTTIAVFSSATVDAGLGFIMANLAAVQRSAIAILEALRTRSHAAVRRRARQTRCTTVAILSSATIHTGMVRIMANFATVRRTALAIRHASHARSHRGITRGTHKRVGTSFPNVARATSNTCVRRTAKLPAVRSSTIVVNHTFDARTHRVVVRSAYLAGGTTIVFFAVASRKTSVRVEIT